MRNGLILMTALPPTVGHLHLIRFASEYLAGFDDDWQIDVIVSARDFEPMPGRIRRDALVADITGPVYIHLHEDDGAPQSPADLHPDFWGYWRKVVRSHTLARADQIVFTSEPYGAPLAEAIGGSWVPCDLGRTTISARATHARQDTIVNFAMLAPATQHRLRKTVTIFGAESCGKTTMARALGASAALGTPGWLPEWARGYLELVGPEITEAKMETITVAQHAAQRVARQRPVPFVIQDTDLLSTLGYYRLWQGSAPDLVDRLARSSMSDLYIVMNSHIPFEADPLRYGGDQRESSDDFWVDLLVERGAQHHVVRSIDRDEQLQEVSGVLLDLFYEQYDMRSFART